MPDPSAVLSQSRSDTTPQFRTAPWFILRDKDIKSKGTALILSVLWTAIPNINERRIVPCLSNKEIARRAGIRGGDWAARYHLQKLENLEYIKREGNHKNRTIEVLVFPEDNDDLRGLIIPQNIFTSNLSPTQKLLTSIRWAFPKMKKAEICRRLNISEWTYFVNIKNSQPLEETKSNPLKNQSEPLEESNPLKGIVGIEFGKGNNPSDYKGTSSPTRVLKNLSMMEDDMQQPPIQGFDYKKAGYLRSCKNCKPLPKEIPIPDDILTELKEEVFQHKHITRATKNSTMAAAAKVVRALRRPGGLSIIMDNHQVEQVVRCLSMGPFPLGSGAIRKTLHKQFDEEERIELYERISNSLSPACGGSGKKVTLADAAYMANGSPGFSRLVLVWLRPPQPKKVGIPSPKIPPDLEQPMKSVGSYMPDSNPAMVLSIIKSLKEHYDKDVHPMLERLGIAEGRGFANWIGDFLRFAYNKAEDQIAPLHPGWIKPGSHTFLEWVIEYKEQAEFESRQRSGGSRLRAQMEREERTENERGFREAYGI